MTPGSSQDPVLAGVARSFDADAAVTVTACPTADADVLVLARADRDRPSAQVLVSTWGTGVYLIEFDGTYSTAVLAYDEVDHDDAVSEVHALAMAFLHDGGGVVQERRRWRWRTREYLEIDVQGEVRRAARPRGR